MEPFQSPFKGMSPQERRRHLIVLQLRRVPQFRELLHMLDRGKSVWATTEWFMAQENRGELSTCTFATARRYIGILAEHMRAVADKVPRRNLSSFRERAYSARLTTLAEAAVQPGPEPSDIEKIITAEIEKLDAETALKFCFAIQKERVLQIRKLETTSNIAFPFADKSVDVLRRIASEMWRVQAGEALLRSRNAWFTDTGDTRKPIDLLPVVREVAELDPTDQVLIREALDKTFDLLEQEAHIGQYSRRVETERGKTEKPEGPSS